MKRQQTAACSQIFRQSRQLRGRTAERQFRVQQALGGLALEHHDRLSGNRFDQVVARVVQHTHSGLPIAEPDGQRFRFAVQRAVLRVSAQEYPACRVADGCRQHEHLYRHRKVVPAREQQPPAACGTQRRRQSGERGRDHAVQYTQPRKVPLSAESDHAQAQSCKKAQRCKCQHRPDRTQHGIAAAECC